MEKQIEEIAYKHVTNNSHDVNLPNWENRQNDFIAGYQAALSKAEYKGDIQDCSLRINGKTMAETLAQQPTNSLDELEYYQNARETFSNAVSNLDVHTRTACDSFILAFDRLLNCSKPNNGWISVKDRLPEIITGNDYSENVIVWLNDERKIMNYALLADDNNNLCYVWCMVYDGLDGDAEFDDNYYPTHWQPLPPKP